MNEPMPHLNESNLKDKMTNKELKEFKDTIYTNKMHFFFCAQS